MKLAPPQEWVTIKGMDQGKMMERGFGLFLVVKRGLGSYEKLAKQYPQVPALRENCAEMSKITAMVYALRNLTDDLVKAWTNTRDMFESLVRDRPDDESYKVALPRRLSRWPKCKRRTRTSPAR